jgi:chromosome segregation ATPase
MSEPMGDASDRMDVDAEEGPSGWNRIGQVIMRLVLVAALGIALGAALYFGVPALVRAWTEPVEANRSQIAVLSAGLESLESAQADRLEAQADRIAELEGALASSQEQMSELESQLERLGSGLSDVEAKQQQLARLSGQIDSLDAELASVEDDLDELMQTGPAAQQMVSALERRFQLLRAMELVSRARMESLRDNDGLAEENLTQATESLQLLLDDSTGAEREALEGVTSRLALAQEELTDTPALAAADMETAWRQLIELSAPTDVSLADGQ